MVPHEAEKHCGFPHLWGTYRYITARPPTRQNAPHPGVSPGSVSRRGPKRAHSSTSENHEPAPPPSTRRPAPPYGTGPTIEHGPTARAREEARRRAPAPRLERPGPPYGTGPTIDHGPGYRARARAGRGLVAVVGYFVRALGGNTDVGGLLGGQHGQLHTEGVEVQACHLLVEQLRQHIHAHRVLLR